MDNNKVGRFIAKLRKKKGLTQDELGNMLGISGKSVSKWERGLNMPDISLIYKLSEVFDVDLNQLLNGEDAIKSVVDLQNEENYEREEKWTSFSERRVASFLFRWAGTTIGNRPVSNSGVVEYG